MGMEAESKGAHDQVSMGETKVHELTGGLGLPTTFMKEKYELKY